MAIVKDDQKKSQSEASIAPNAEMIAQLKSEIKAELKTAEPNSDATAELLTQLVDRLSGKSDKDKYGTGFTYVDEVDIDQEDLLDAKDAVTFFSGSVGYIIVDDMRNGHPVQTPYRRPIKFVYQSTKRREKGKDTDLINLASFTSISKKEVEWLKAHTFFGSIFFLRSDVSMNSDIRRAAKMARYMSSFNGMNQHQLIKMCRDNNLPLVGDELGDLKALLASHFAQKLIEQEDQALEINVVENAKDRIMVDENVDNNR